MVLHACYLSTQDAKAGGLEVQGQSWLHEFQEEKKNQNESPQKICKYDGCRLEKEGMEANR